MGRKDSRAIRNITRLCIINDMDENDLYNKGLKILSLYREMGWNSVICNTKNVETDLLKREDEIRQALDYLQHLPEEEEDYTVEKSLRPLFDSGIVQEMMRYAMSKVQEYPHDGELYYRYIRYCFLDGTKHTADEIMELLGISRGTYYDKRKEGITLFGVTLWGFAIPYLTEHLEESLKEFKLLVEAMGTEQQ